MFLTTFLAGYAYKESPFKFKPIQQICVNVIEALKSTNHHRMRLINNFPKKIRIQERSPKKEDAKNIIKQLQKRQERFASLPYATYRLRKTRLTLASNHDDHGGFVPEISRFFSFYFPPIQISLLFHVSSTTVCPHHPPPPPLKALLPTLLIYASI